MVVLLLLLSERCYLMSIRRQGLVSCFSSFQSTIRSPLNPWHNSNNQSTFTFPSGTKGHLLFTRRTFARSRKVIHRKEDPRPLQESIISSNLYELEDDTNGNRLYNSDLVFSSSQASSDSTLIHSDWIPPNRPLSGDSSHHSSYYDDAGAAAAQDWEKQVDDDQLKRIIQKEAEVTGRSVQYFDLDTLDLETMDWKQLEEQMKAWDFSNTTTSTADAASLEQLFEKEDLMLQAMELGDDDGWEEDIDTEEDEHAENNGNKITIEDPILKEILSDNELFDENDEEAMKIQLQLIGERLKQIREEKKQRDKQASPLSTGSSASSSSSSSSSKTILSSSAASILQEDKFFPRPQDEQQKSLARSTTVRDKSSQGPPNWLQTRQSKMQVENATWTPANMMLPSEAANRRRLDSSIPIIPHTLLSSREIVSCLNALGGQDIKVITPDEKTKVALGWDGLIVATGSSFAHIRVMADAIVKNLRLRDLTSKGVVGAIHGVEGGDNEASSSFRNRKTGRGSNKDDGWMIVDCRNYVVHVQDETTRKSIDLEALWSPGERGKEGRILRQVSSLNDEQADDYVSQRPIPDDYTNSLMALSAEINGLMSNAALKQRKTSVQNASKGKSKMSNRSSKSRF